MIIGADAGSLNKVLVILGVTFLHVSYNVSLLIISFHTGWTLMGLCFCPLTFAVDKVSSEVFSVILHCFKIFPAELAGGNIPGYWWWRFGLLT